MHVPDWGCFCVIALLQGGGTLERVTFSFILSLSFYAVSFF